MGQKDIISKDLVERLSVCLVTQLLQLDIEPNSLQLLNTEQHRVEDRRADMVAQVRHTQDQSVYLLHVEIQNNNHAQMPLRMLRYYTDICLSWPGKLLKQYVVYIGKEALTMPAGLADFNYHYDIIDLHTIDYSLFLKEDTPDALVLAILCDFKSEQPEKVVNYIMQRLRDLTGDNSPEFRRYLYILEILSDNRDLKTTVKETEKMLTEVNLENLPSYELGWERGIDQGIQKGIQEGRQAYAPT